MKIRYYNEHTGESFDTEQEAAESEKKYIAVQEAKKRAAEVAKAAEEKKKQERAERAKEVQEALKEAIAMRKSFQEKLDIFQDKLSDFCEEYGAFHFSTNDLDADESVSLFNLINSIF